MCNNIDQLISSIPIWQNKIIISKIDGGITNQNFLVTDSNKKYFVRVGEDIPEHLVSRSNELNSSIAAASLGIAPEVIYNNENLQVIKFIESKTLNDKDVKEKIEDIILLIRKVHKEIPKKLNGQSIIFWVFHVIRHYSNYLENNKSKYSSMLSDLLTKSQILEEKSSPYEIVFGHNDLLPANFLDDGNRLWLIDWEYAGYNTPLFDLGGLSSNNNFNPKEEIFLLENYFEKKINPQLLNQYNCLKCASLLRETMWSMVSEITSNIDFDYANYTDENLLKFGETYKNIL
jgi:thiamine kinase-like enzyme